MISLSSYLPGDSIHPSNFDAIFAAASTVSVTSETTFSGTSIISRSQVLNVQEEFFENKLLEGDPNKQRLKMFPSATKNHKRLSASKIYATWKNG